MNGKLIIRVGGGYMLIDEFLKNYAEIEKDKLGAIVAAEDGDGFTAVSPSKLKK